MSPRTPQRIDPAETRESAPIGLLGRRRFTPRAGASGHPVRCPECGLTLHAATVAHEQSLIFASCCPRCDGQLTAQLHEAASCPEPSIFLG